ncbi:hypothetical protein GCM10010145_38420 [Streptomyces ruber]|uniref:ATP-binding protein n=2 Tax=Streptomyces TaxID=1883 RepID=A0A918BGE3_9ACTN|nr:hypothetical protein GCM10010145_38420 [Streptomyces ruber]
MIDALRRGAVPENGLDLLATGLDRFQEALDAELNSVASGASVFKAVRGEYGAGKTFFARWLGERAKRRNFAVAEIQVSETETPLHKLETVYRRLTERLATPGFPRARSAPSSMPGSTPLRRMPSPRTQRRRICPQKWNG